MDLDRLQIRIEADSKSASASINRLVNKLDKLSSSMSKLNTAPIENFTKSATKLNNLNFSSLSKGMNKTSGSMKSMSKSSHSLAASFGKFYASYFLVIRGIKGLWNSIGKTADYMEALNYYTVSFNKIAGDWNKDWEKYGYKNAEEYSSSFVERMNETLRKLSGVEYDAETGLLSSTGLKNLGLNIQEVTQYVSQLASVTNSVGQTGEVSLATASALTKLAGDMSSLFNVDYSAVAKNLQSGLIGQSRALYKYGIDITNATLQTYAYEQGLEKAVSEMTQSEKMQLRILAILDQSKVAWGDQANTINSLSNGIRMLKNNLSEAGMVLGQLFVPMMQRVIPIANGATIAIKGLLTNLAGLLGIEIDSDSFGKGFADGSEGLDEFTDGLEDVTSAAKKAKMGLRGFDELNVLNSGSGSGTGSAMASFDLTEQIKKATEEYEAYWAKAYENMQSKAEEFAKKISKALDPVKNLFKNLFTGDFKSAGMNVSGIITSLFDSISAGIQGMDGKKLGENIANLFNGLNWSEIFLSVGNAIGSGLQFAFDFATGIVDATSLKTKISEGFGGVLLLMQERLQPAIQFLSETVIPDLVAGWGRLLEVLTPLGEFLEKVFVSIWQDMIKPALEHVGTNIIPKVADAFTHLWNDVLVPLGKLLANILSPAIQIVSDILSNLWENVVVPLGQAIGSVLGTAIESVIIIFNNFAKKAKVVLSVLTWIWEKAIGPLVEAMWNNLKPAFDEVGKFIKNVINSLKLKLTGFIKFFTGAFTRDLGMALDGVKDVFKGVFNSIIGVAELFINTIINGINRVLGGINSLVSGVGELIGLEISIPLISRVELPKFAVGGFPEDGLFMANHSELVGKFSNGRTAVANNDQITQGIADAVYPAVYNAVSAAFANKSADPIRVYVGDRELTDIVVDGINQRTRAGHQPLYGW